MVPTIDYHDGCYHTPEKKVGVLAKWLPSLVGYSQIVATVVRASRAAKETQMIEGPYVQASYEIIRAFESVGARFHVCGWQHLKGFEPPVVFIANHMSTLETFALPNILYSFSDVIFVVKESLVNYPVFGRVMRARWPIVVTRKHPRTDFKIVMEEGLKRLAAGKSVVVFPQTTRTSFFDVAQFNSIGVKLARRARVPVVPIALKTDAWTNGRLIKDFGKIDPNRSIHFEIGEPRSVSGDGRDTHQEVVDFIRNRVDAWTK
jgi:1-acyl-sn-glycerol-3-phosphate acyltransferase